MLIIWYLPRHHPSQPAVSRRRPCSAPGRHQGLPVSARGCETRQWKMDLWWIFHDLRCQMVVSSISGSTCWYRILYNIVHDHFVEKMEVSSFGIQFWEYKMICLMSFRGWIDVPQPVWFKYNKTESFGYHQLGMVAAVECLRWKELWLLKKDWSWRQLEHERQYSNRMFMLSYYPGYPPPEKQPSRPSRGMLVAVHAKPYMWMMIWSSGFSF